MKNEKWEIKKDSAIPYIAKISILDGTNDIVYCRFLWTRWLNFDHYQLVKRGLVICGIPVDKCAEYVEKQFSVLQWLVNPTELNDLPTGIPHEPGIQTM